MNKKRFTKNRTTYFLIAGKAITGLLLFVYFQYLLATGTIGQYDGMFTGHFRIVSAAAAVGGTMVWIFGRIVFNRIPHVRDFFFAWFLALTPVLLFFILEICWNDRLSSFTFVHAAYNFFLYGFLTLVFYRLIRKKLIGLSILYILAFLVGSANHFVYAFRGSPILPTDLFSVRTALRVSGQYSYQMTDGMALGLLLLYLALTVVWAFSDVPDCSFASIVSLFSRLHSQGEGTASMSAAANHNYSEIGSKGRLFLFLLFSIIPAAAFISLILFLNVGSVFRIDLDYWDPENTYKEHGLFPSFLTCLQNMKIEKPEGYSLRAVQDILSPYDEKEDYRNTKIPEGRSESPAIIAIMNEAFSDISALGPLACCQEQLDFLYSLADDPGTLAFGYDYVSTRGGGTSTTEFEFLTGDSISNVNGLNPYAMFDFRGVPSLVEQLEALGYHTIAMHPEQKENWRRSTVYPALGFDECLWIDSYEGYEHTLYDRVSDLGDYQKLIDVYEQTEGPLFLFNVTMQNHGSYSDLWALDEAEWVDIDSQYSQYTDLQLYQSLIAKADDALEYLIDYFRAVEEPVVICFFGDHQPNLTTEFEDSLLEAGRTDGDEDLSLWEKRYVVPYFIWSNTSPQAPFYNAKGTSQRVLALNGAGQNDTNDRMSRETSEISTNYLSSVLLECMDMPLAPFNQYLLAQQKDIPILNFGGYKTSDGTWHYLEDDTEQKHWLNDYQILQYNSLFDKRRDSSLYIQEGNG